MPVLLDWLNLEYADTKYENKYFGFMFFALPISFLLTFVKIVYIEKHNIIKGFFGLTAVFGAIVSVLIMFIGPLIFAHIQQKKFIILISSIQVLRLLLEILVVEL